MSSGSGAAGGGGGGSGGRQARRGPAPFASFDHDVSDESSPESKLTFQLPEIREDSGTTAGSVPGEGNISPSTAAGLAPPEQRARSHSTPVVHGALSTPAAPRIDISRASSSSHHDSRDSSPEMALFAGTGGDNGASTGDRAQLELGFREDGALDLRSSTEELAFLEPDTAPGERELPRAPSAARRSPGPSASPAPGPTGSAAERRHSRKDSQSSEALLAISGRQSRLSSIGSQGSAHSAISNASHLSEYSHVSKLSVISGVSRSPSPHKMLLETSFCGPKPIEAEPEPCAAVTERRLLEITTLSDNILGRPIDYRRRSAPHVSTKSEVRTEVTIENVTRKEAGESGASAREPHTTQASTLAGPPVAQEDVKQQKELSNQMKVEQQKISTSTDRVKPKRRNRPPESTPEVYSSRNKSKNIIRIKLKPDHEYEDDEEDESERTLVGREALQKPDSLHLGERSKKPAHFSELVGDTETVPKALCAEADKRLSSKTKVTSESSPGVSPTPSRKAAPKDHDSRTPSPAGAVSVSRKSSFCSLFKSKEMIASPDSPSTAHLKRKKSVNEGTRSRSKSRDRSTTPTSGNKIKGSVLSLFKTPKKGGASLSPSSRESSPVIQSVPPRQFAHQHVEVPKTSDKLKYYEESKDGIIHIPLHTPPDEQPSTSGGGCSKTRPEPKLVQVHQEQTKESTTSSPTPASAPAEHTPVGHAPDAPQHPAKGKKQQVKKTSQPVKPIKRTVLPDGSIIIPLHSPTEKISVLEDKSPQVDKTSPVKIEEPKVVQKVTKKDEVAGRSKSMIKEISSDSVCPETPNETKEPIQRKKERITFVTSVGSKEQLFSTQFSLTKTPSVTSEISGSFPSFQEGVIDAKCDLNSQNILRDTHITTVETPIKEELVTPPAVVRRENVQRQKAHTPDRTSSESPLDLTPVAEGGSGIMKSKSNDDVPDSSESELSSEVGTFKKNTLHDLIAEGIPAEEVEKKSLVVTQESFEEELPYVPTTLPQERSVALPMVPVRERGSTAAVRVRPVDRPRSTTPIHRSAFEEYLSDEPRTPDNAKTDKIKISLPTTGDKLTHKRSRSPRRASQSAQPWDRFAERGLPQTPPRRSSAAQAQSKQWINFEDVPERRKQPKRIQTIPREKTPEMRRSTSGEDGASGEGASVVYSYVEPEECRCECHAARREDQTPLLADHAHGVLHSSNSFQSDSSVECDGVAGAVGDVAEELQLSVQIGRPFTMDLQLRGDRSSLEQEATSPADGAGRH